MRAIFPDSHHGQNFPASFIYFIDFCCRNIVVISTCLHWGSTAMLINILHRPGKELLTYILICVLLAISFIKFCVMFACSCAWVQGYVCQHETIGSLRITSRFFFASHHVWERFYFLPSVYTRVSGPQSSKDSSVPASHFTISVLKLCTWIKLFGLTRFLGFHL